MMPIVQRFPWRSSRLSIAAFVLGLISSAAVAAELRTDYLLFNDPAIAEPDEFTSFPQRLAAVWNEALTRPEIDLQRMAAESIARGARLNVNGLEATIPRLRELVTADATQIIPRIAAARALAALNAKDSAPDLAAAAAKYDGEFRWVSERALGLWRYEPIRAEWRSRLTSPQIRHRDMKLAISGLGLAEDQEALPRLLEIVHDMRAAADLRVEAARSSALISPEEGVVDHARRLVESSAGAASLRKVCALRLLTRSRRPLALELLRTLAVDAEPAIAAEALRLLNEIDSKLVLPLAGQALENQDGKVRREGLVAYVRFPAVERIPAIAARLDDALPTLRREACESLHRLLDQPELEGAIWAAVMEQLTRSGWRGQEQAALLVGQRGYQPAAPRLLELQYVARVEPRVTAAWALRKVAVRETCPAILTRCEQLTTQRTTADLVEGLDEQVGHLFEALAVMEHWQAEPLWMKYIPKDLGMGVYSRCCAIWALGIRHNGVHRPELAVQLVERLTDPLLPPELELVRYACAVSLARIQASEQIDRMRKWVGEEALDTGHVAAKHALGVRWAIEQLTGKSLPPVQKLPRGRSGWFLEPTDAN